MSTLQNLRDKRAAAWAKAQEFNERAEAGTELSGEDETSWRSALAEVDSLGADIEMREKTEDLGKRFADIDDAVERDSGISADPESEYRSAFVAYLRGGAEGLAMEQRALLQANFRAQQTTTGAAGGYTVPQGFWAKVTEAMKAYNSVAEVSEFLSTESGNPLQWPTNDDTSNKGARLTEGSQVTEQDLAFGSKTLGAYTYTSKMVRVSLQLIQDSGIDVESFLARKLGERLGRIHNEEFTTGTGSAQPQGVVTGATTGKTAASATAITLDEIIDLEHSVDVAYRANATFMLNDLVLAVLRKLKDNDGQYLWQPSVQAGVPDRLHGYGVVVNNDMASAVATGAKTVLFGDFRAGYVARVAKQAELMRLTERYADYLQVGFLAFDRADGLVQDAGAVKLLVQA